MKKKLILVALILFVLELAAVNNAIAEYLDTLWKKDLWPSYPTLAHMTPDGQYVISSRGNKLYKYSTLNGDSISTFVDVCDTTIYDLYISKSGTKISTRDSKQKFVYLWDYTQETIIKKINILDSYGHIGLTLISNDDKYIIISTIVENTNNLIFYGIEEDSIVKVISVRRHIAAMALSPDGKYLVIGTEHRDEISQKYYSYLTLCSMDSLYLISEFGNLDWTIQSLKYSPDGELLTCGRNVISLTIWDMGSRTMIKEIPIEEDSVSVYQVGAFTKNNDFLVLGGKATLKTILYDYKNDSVLATLTVPSKIIDIYPDSNYILLSSRKIYVLKLNPGTNQVTDKEGDSPLQVVYPNPATDYIEISYSPSREGAGGVSVEIYNVFGEKMEHPIPDLSTPVSSADTPASGGQVRVDVSGLAAGVYFVRIGNRTERFVIIR